MCQKVTEVAATALIEKKDKAKRGFQ